MFNGRYVFYNETFKLQLSSINLHNFSSSLFRCLETCPSRSCYILWLVLNLIRFKTSNCCQVQSTNSSKQLIFLLYSFHAHQKIINLTIDFWNNSFKNSRTIYQSITRMKLFWSWYPIWSKSNLSNAEESRTIQSKVQVYIILMLLKRISDRKCSLF
jgi:hypothetical protein